MREQCLGELYTLSAASAYSRRHAKLIAAILVALTVAIVTGAVVIVEVLKQPTPCYKSIQWKDARKFEQYIV